MAPDDLDWFVVPVGEGGALLVPGARVTLPPEEAQHALKSLRLKAGAPLVLTDGQGRVARARVEEAGRRDLVAQVDTVEEVPPPARPLWLAAAVVRGPRFDFVIEKATELGVTGFVPLLTRHSEVRPGAGGEKSDRWRRLTLAAAKQSRRAWLPEILPPLELSGVMGRFPGAAAWVAHPESALVPSGQTLEGTLDRSSGSGDSSPGGDILLTGPEGGWHPAELEALTGAGARFVHLGEARLRAETAALALLVWALTRRESLRDRGTP